MPNPLTNLDPIFPSHGRGPRFDPVSAHQKPFEYQGLPKRPFRKLGTSRQNTARTGKFDVEKTLDSVPRMFTGAKR